ncbi:MAG: ATP-binding protein [Actinomycetota bacterium]|nr:ATP-binding protein [Actinomycetota bacterium]
MRRLLQNLIVNALKFHRPGEPPLVRVSARAIFDDDDPNPVAHELAVADNGVGFDEANRDWIFQPFQRLRGLSEYGGAGLGLAICRRIVERHSGRVTATSEPGRGATFWVTLPVRPVDRMDSARDEQPPGERDGERHV